MTLKKCLKRSSCYCTQCNIKASVEESNFLNSKPWFTSWDISVSFTSHLFTHQLWFYMTPNIDSLSKNQIEKLIFSEPNFPSSVFPCGASTIRTETTNTVRDRNILGSQHLQSATNPRSALVQARYDLRNPRGGPSIPGTAGSGRAGSPSPRPVAPPAARPRCRAGTRPPSPAANSALASSAKSRQNPAGTGARKKNHSSFSQQVFVRRYYK